VFSVIVLFSCVLTCVDFLISLRYLFRSQCDLSQARYAYLLSHLRLKFVAGTVSEADLGSLNALLTGG